MFIKYLNKVKITITTTILCYKTLYSATNAINEKYPGTYCKYIKTDAKRSCQKSIKFKCQLMPPK